MSKARTVADEAVLRFAHLLRDAYLGLYIEGERDRFRREEVRELSRIGVAGWERYARALLGQGVRPPLGGEDAR